MQKNGTRYAILTYRADLGSLCDDGFILNVFHSGTYYTR